MIDEFDIFWHLNASDDCNYAVVCSQQTGLYSIFAADDLEYKQSFVENGDNIDVKITYTLRERYKKITGKILTQHKEFYVIAKNNLLHCETGPAALTPGGLDNFVPYTPIKDYVIHGKVMSYKSWLNWIKYTDVWDQVMADVLGTNKSITNF